MKRFITTDKNDFLDTVWTKMQSLQKIENKFVEKKKCSKSGQT